MTDLRLVVCDLSGAPTLDVAAVRMLAGLHKDLAKRQIRLRVVEAHAKSRDLLRAEGLEEQVGYLGRHISVDQVIAEFHDNGAAASTTKQERVADAATC